ncbi:hypothetical protein GC194_06450 [bacterium]|nr:hypothetical protein [bacterium]
MKQFSLLLNIMAAVIIFIAVLGIMYLGFQHLRKQENPKRIEIVYTLANDSIVDNSVVKIGNLESLMNELKSISNEIQAKQIETINKDEDKGIFDKFYSIIVAVVLVFAGFFGFKNITEIKTRAIEIAEESSKKIAEDTAINASEKQFEKVFTAQYKGEVLDLATASFSKVIDQEVTQLYNQITLLESRIDALEGNQTIDNIDGDDGYADGPADGENTEDNHLPLNPFDNE